MSLWRTRHGWSSRLLQAGEFWQMACNSDLNQVQHREAASSTLLHMHALAAVTACMRALVTLLACMRALAAVTACRRALVTVICLLVLVKVHSDALRQSTKANATPHDIYQGWLWHQLLPMLHLEWRGGWPQVVAVLWL
jgi:hypothetical protein